MSTRGTGKNCNFSLAEDIKVLGMKNKWVYDRILTSLFGIPICMFSIQKKLIKKKRKKNQGEEKYKEKKTRISQSSSNSNKHIKILICYRIDQQR